MIRTRVGYTGGTIADPTYTRLYDHSEAIQIDCDPALISYEKLVEIFWESHDPASQPWSKQYRAALFYHDEEQKGIALETRDRLAAKLKGKVRTELLPASEFYRAEDYHQKYRLRSHRALMAVFNDLYGDSVAFTDSTAAARLNGYLGSHGTLPDLEGELKNLDLPDGADEKLMAIVSGKR